MEQGKIQLRFASYANKKRVLPNMLHLLTHTNSRNFESSGRAFRRLTICALFVGVFSSCEENDSDSSRKNSNQARKTNLNNETSKVGIEGNDADFEELIFNTVFEKTEKMLLNETLLRDPYVTIDMPDEVFVPEEIAEICVRIEGISQVILVGGSSIEDFIHSHQGFQIITTTRSQKVNERNIEVKIKKLILNL